MKAKPLAATILCVFLVLCTVAFQVRLSNAGSGYYRDYASFIADFENLASRFPSLVTYQTVGQTVENNSIIMFRIGNPAGGRVLIDAAIHGEETLGSEMLYDYAEWLLTSNNALANYILTHTCTLLIPAVNVDNYNVMRVNANHVDLNRNFATNWQNAGDTNTTSWEYRGPSPLSEPETQTLERVFQTYRPSFYINLHFAGGAYYLGSIYGNTTYYNSLVNKINSLSQSRGILPYTFYWTDGPGYAMSDAARMGITSFLLELTSNLTIPLSAIGTTILPKFIPIAAVLSQECGSTFGGGFESGDFSCWTGTSLTPGETATVVNTTSDQGNYCAQFTSSGTGGFEAAYCYDSVTASSSLYAGGYFYVSQSGIAGNDDCFYLIEFLAGGNDVAYAGWLRTGGVDTWTLLIRNAIGWASAYSNFSPSLDKWHSVELYWAEGAADGYGELYVDKTLACSIQNQNTTAFGGINEVRLGLAEVYSSGPTTVYADSCRILSTPPWDINQDGTVNMLDVAIFVTAFGSTHSSSNWNPATDINGDGRVDMRDLAILTSHYGERYS